MFALNMLFTLLLLALGIYVRLGYMGQQRKPVGVQIMALALIPIVFAAASQIS